MANYFLKWLLSLIKVSLRIHIVIWIFININLYNFQIKLASHCQNIWWFDGSHGKPEGKSGSGNAYLDDRMWFWRIGWNWKDFDMSDSIGWIASDYLFLSLHEMHYGINITKLYPIGRAMGTKNRMESEQYESHQIMSVNTNAFKLFKIVQWDASFS